MTIESLIERLRDEGGHDLSETALVEDIATTEAEIGHPLPDSYKTFVSRFSNGSYLFMIQEVSAVGAGSGQYVAIQDIERFPKRSSEVVIPFREGGETTYGSLVPFSLDSNGNEWCFIVEPGPPGNEYEVAYLDSTNGKLYGRLNGFREWLSILVDASPRDEVIRLLYGDDVIYDELGLG